MIVAVEMLTEAGVEILAAYPTLPVDDDDML
jgi:hypothetical protein